jgi:RNA polymerase sigma-70 factor (ECF subfamily)
MKGSETMYQNPRRLRRPEERVGTVTNADLPPPFALTDEDSSLVQRLRTRDDSAFQQVFDRYYSSMLRVAATFVRTPDEAHEVIQETWIAVMESIDEFQGRASFRTWLFRILINRARTRAQREARVIAFSTLGIDAAVEAAAPWPGVEPARNDPEQMLLNSELRARLEAALQGLPRSQRLVISLRDVEGWSAREVCAALGLSASNQRVLLHRARLHVRAALRPYLEGVN